MSKMLKQAMVDAKAVREIALRNAKMALEEAFAPRLNSMLSAKIQQEVEGEDGSEEETSEVPVDDVPVDDIPTEEPTADEVPTDDVPVDAPVGDDVPAEPAAAPAADAPATDEVPTEEPAVEEEPPVEEPPVEDGFDPNTEADDLDLESIIRELETEVAGEDEDEMHFEGFEAESDEEPDGDADDTEAVKNEIKMVSKPLGKPLKEDEVPGDEDTVDEEINIEEILRELNAEDGETLPESAPVNESDDNDEDDKEKEEMKETIVKLTNELKSVTKSLAEHAEVVKFFRSKMNELNLLNSKLLFTNKLFKSSTLNDEQKMKVIENFDRAKSLREVKIVYTTLAETYNEMASIKRADARKSVKKISEGFASKPIAATKVPVIKEQTEVKPAIQDQLVSPEVADRLRQLANIKRK